MTKKVVGPGFHAKVFAKVKQVPAGKVTTYGDIAEKLGSKSVARHVGFAMAALPEHRDDVPWHRVVNSQGRISPSGSFERQRALLMREGLVIDAAGKIVNFKAYRHKFRR